MVRTLTFRAESLMMSPMDQKISNCCITLKPKKEGNVLFRHPWIFSGAIEYVPNEVEHGSMVFVKDASGKVIGTGTYSKWSSISVRVFEFYEAEIDGAWFEKKFTEADARRKLLGYGPKTDTTGYRLIFGEADGVPGLVVDKYKDTLVIQISTAGIEKLKEEVLSALKKVFKPKIIIERSDLPVRIEEKLYEHKGILAGKFDKTVNDGLVEFKENGLTFFADPLEGQKTGFFCDQKDLRHALGKISKGREVLDLFSYSGAAGIYALQGGAKKVTFVDGSQRALDLCEKNVKANFEKAKVETICADLFQFLGKANPASYDMVILDPPALIPSRHVQENGKKAYHFLNRAGLRLLKDGGIFVTSSCSHFLSEDDFIFLLRRASVQAGVTLHMLAHIVQSADHPLSVTFPESKYLKSFVFVVSHDPACNCN